MVKLAARDISSFLNQPDKNGVRAVVVYGPNQTKVREHAQRVCEWTVPDIHDAFAVTSIRADEYDSQSTSLADELNTLNMLGGRRLIHIRQAGDKMTAALKQALSDYRGENYAVIEAGELSPRSSLRKWAETQNNVAALACYDESAQELATILIEKLAQNGFKADYDVRQYFTNMYGSNRMEAEAELDKIMCYVGFPDMGAQKEVTLADVQACTGNRADQTLDILLQHVMDSDFSTLDKAYHALIQDGVSEVYILRSLQNYIARLSFVHILLNSGLSQNEAIKKLQPPVFFKNKPAFQKHLSLWSLDRLDKAQDRLIRTEAAIKQTGVPAQELTQRTLMALAHQAKSAQNRSI